MTSSLSALCHPPGELVDVGRDEAAEVLESVEDGVAEPAQRALLLPDHGHQLDGAVVRVVALLHVDHLLHELLQWESKEWVNNQVITLGGNLR